VIGLTPESKVEWTVVDGSGRRQQGLLPPDRVIRSDLVFPAYIQLEVEDEPAWGSVVDGELEQEVQIHVPATGELELVFDPAIPRAENSQASLLDPSNIQNFDSMRAHGLFESAARGHFNPFFDLDSILYETIEREEGTWGLTTHTGKIPEDGIVLWKQVPANVPLRWASRDLTGTVIQPRHESWEEARTGGYGLDRPRIRENLSGTFEVTPQTRTRFVMGDEASSRLRVVLPEGAVSGILRVMDRGHSILPEGGPLETIAQLIKVQQRGPGFLVSGLVPAEYGLWARWRLEDGCFAFSRTRASFPARGESVVYLHTDNQERVRVEIPFTSGTGDILGMFDSGAALVFIHCADRKRPMYTVMFPVDLSEPIQIEGLPNNRALKIRIQPEGAIPVPNDWKAIRLPPGLVTHVNEGPLWSVPYELVSDRPVTLRIATSTGEPFSTGTLDYRTSTSEPVGLAFDIQNDGTALIKLWNLTEVVLLKVTAISKTSTRYSGLHVFDPDVPQVGVIKISPATSISGQLVKGTRPFLSFYPKKYREQFGASIENILPVSVEQDSTFRSYLFPANMTLGVKGSPLIYTTAGPGEVLDLGVIELD
jgi:hypothetical protein